MKALIFDCNNQVYVIRNSKGKIFQCIGRRNELSRPQWSWMITFLCDHSTSPGYIINGKFLKDIPSHVLRIFKIIQKKH